jgi:uncharacterized membrane protein
MAKAKEAAKPAKAESAASKDDEGKIFAFLAYLLGIIGFLIVLLAKKDNKFAMYHAKQSLVLSIVALIVWIPAAIITALIGWIPVIGWIIAILIWIVVMIVMLGLFVLLVIGIINALSDKMQPLPVIGKFGDKFNF